MLITTPSPFALCCYRLIFFKTCVTGVWLVSFLTLTFTWMIQNGLLMGIQYIIFLLIKGGYFYLILVMTKANLIGFLII